MPDENHTQTLNLGISDVVTWGAAGKEALTPVVHIGHVDWVLGACVKSNEQLDVFVKCKEESRSNLWSCQASVRFSLVKLGAKDKNDAFTVDFEQKFDRKNKVLSASSFKTWKSVTDPTSQFLLNKQIAIEAQITIKSVVGIYEKIIKTFDTPRKNLTDVVLIVQGKKVHVGKQFLAHFSEYFSTLFFGKFAESAKSEVVIEDVEYTEFLDLLNLMYPTHKKIDDVNVGHLLLLADRFVVPHVMEKCENWLISSNACDLVVKLMYAETYRLSALQEDCLAELRSKYDVLDLTNETGYLSLGEKSQAVLFEKVVDLLKNPSDYDEE